MTVREAYDIYIHILDKYGAPGVEPFEFSRHFNTAQDLWLQEFYHAYRRRANIKQDPGYGVESHQQIIEMLQPILHVVSVEAGSTVAYETIRNQLPNITVRDEIGPIETKRAEIFHIMSVSRLQRNGGMRMCRYVQHNRWELARNSFINTPTVINPIYRHIREGLQFLPDALAANYQISLIRHPRPVWLDQENPANNINPDFGTAACHYIILRALQLTGIQIRESDFYQFVSAESAQQ